MRKSENLPYVKKYDEKGVLVNPIHRIYPTVDQNRQERRWKEPRFIGNGKNHPITVVKTKKFRRLLQRYYKADGSIGIVKHWLEN